MSLQPGDAYKRNVSEVAIDLSAVVRNAEKIKKQSPLIAVVKDDAYGHGSIAVAKSLEATADGFAVTTIAEAEELVDAGIARDILVLGPSHCCTSAKNIIYTVSSVAETDRLCRFRRPKVAVKINTGMNRFGAEPADAPRLIGYVRERADLHSVYSHLREPENADLSAVQLARFRTATDGLGVKRHLSASRGFLLGGDYAFDAVRCGIALYGGIDGFEQAMSVYAPVLAIRDVPTGEGVGYGSEVFERPARVAVLGIGYADGYRRLSSPRYVVIAGKKCRVVSVCMDVSFAVLEGTEVSDTAEVLGKNLTASELAESYGTITYEVFTSFGRLAKRYG